MEMRLGLSGSDHYRLDPPRGSPLPVRRLPAFFGKAPLDPTLTSRHDSKLSGRVVAYAPPVPRRLTFLEALILTFIAERPRKLTAADLARELAVDVELVVRVCHDLETAGLISQR